jgi:hypothetical protein
MKRIIVPILILSLLAGGCKYFPGKKDTKKVDTMAIWQAKQDSLGKIQAAIAEKEKAVQDSLQRIQDALAKLKFHVIIGSFKVPTNADSWQQEVGKMGFNGAKIIDSDNGFKLVSIGAYETYSKAFTEIGRINEGKEQPTELWIYETK